VPFDVSPVFYFGFITYYLKKNLLKMYLTIGRLLLKIDGNKCEEKVTDIKFLLVIWLKLFYFLMTLLN